MAANINADTSGGLKLESDTSGVLELKSAGTTIATVSSTGLAMASGKLLASTGPAFSAYRATSQSIATSTFTKVAINTELFDTNSNFNTSTYAFTPTVAGYYAVSGNVLLTSVKNVMVVEIWKNGAALVRGTQQVNTALSSSRAMHVTTLVYMNGSSDYLNLYAYHTTGTTQTILGGSRYAYFSAHLARAA